MGLVWSGRHRSSGVGHGIAIDVPQCGFCQSGQVMSAIGLLAAKPRPSDDDIDHGMAGNICRCAAYVRIRQAIHDAAKALEKTA